MTFGIDIDWDNWESSFNDDFWMTVEERAVEEKRKLTELSEKEHVKELAEQMAVESLFQLFDTAPNQKPNTLNEDEIRDEVEKNASEILDNHDSFVLNMEDSTFPSDDYTFSEEDSTFPSKQVVHEIPQKDDIISQILPEKTDQTSKQYNIVPVDPEERGRREEEQVNKLKDKESYSILKYTQQQNVGIKATEGKSKKRSTSPFTSNKQDNNIGIQATEGKSKKRSASTFSSNKQDNGNCEKKKRSRVDNDSKHKSKMTDTTKKNSIGNKDESNTKKYAGKHNNNNNKQNKKVCEILSMGELLFQFLILISSRL